MKEKLEFRKLREFGDLIGDTIVFIRQNFKPLMKAIFSFCGIFIIGSIISMVIQKMAIPTPNPYNYSFWDTMSGIMFTWQYLMLIVFSVLNYTAIYVTVLSYISIYINKGNVAPTIDEIWAYFKYYFLRMFGSLFTMSLFLILCFALCFFPGVYMFPSFCIFFPIMILENGSFSYSFGRSYTLLKDEWWITAAVIFIIYAITFAATFIVQIPVFVLRIIETISHLKGANPFNLTYSAIEAIFTHLAQILMIIPIICSALIYFNLVERKESSGLLGRIEGLGKNFNTPPTESIPEEY
ncbi:MAG: hypothetical protein EOP00_01845 [Pedobacter sp.]|nr:MAG: hypothetical protein EOP00_01845 [Pedobacter sp.]